QRHDHDDGDELDHHAHDRHDTDDHRHDDPHHDHRHHHDHRDLDHHVDNDDRQWRDPGALGLGARRPAPGQLGGRLGHVGWGHGIPEAAGEKAALGSAER